MRCLCARSRTRWASCTRWTTTRRGAAGWSGCWRSWKSGERLSPPVQLSANNRSTSTGCTCSCATAAVSSRYYYFTILHCFKEMEKMRLSSIYFVNYKIFLKCTRRFQMIFICVHSALQFVADSILQIGFCLPQ